MKNLLRSINKESEQSSRQSLKSLLGPEYTEWTTSLRFGYHPTEDDFKEYDDGKYIPPVVLDTPDDFEFDKRCQNIHEHAAHCNLCRDALNTLRNTYQE